MYPVHSWHYCIDAYEDPAGDWLKCRHCGLKPKIWVFDNGRSTACGCWESEYDHFSIHAESISSAVKRTGGFIDYNPDKLRTNWNYWCATGEVIFDHASKRIDGRW